MSILQAYINRQLRALIDIYTCTERACCPKTWVDTLRYPYVYMDMIICVRNNQLFHNVQQNCSLPNPFSKKTHVVKLHKIMQGVSKHTNMI